MGVMGSGLSPLLHSSHCGFSLLRYSHCCVVLTTAHSHHRTILTVYAHPLEYLHLAGHSLLLLEHPAGSHRPFNLGPYIPNYLEQVNDFGNLRGGLGGDLLAGSLYSKNTAYGKGGSRFEAVRGKVPGTRVREEDIDGERREAA